VSITNSLEEPSDGKERQQEIKHREVDQAAEVTQTGGQPQRTGPALRISKRVLEAKCQRKAARNLAPGSRSSYGSHPGWPATTTNWSCAEDFEARTGGKMPKKGSKKLSTGKSIKLRKSPRLAANHNELILR
jgi:hypothetical protein